MPVLPFPSAGKCPQHLAIIMDGNRRWAQKRALPKALGHARGAQAVHRIVQACADQGIRYLTLFAFSTENWQRPQEEVSGLMGLFMHYLEHEAQRMKEQGVRLKVIGDLRRFDARLQNLIQSAQASTAEHTRINLTLAANYGGRWDMLQATRAWQQDHPHQSLEALAPHAWPSGGLAGLLRRESAWVNITFTNSGIGLQHVQGTFREPHRDVPEMTYRVFRDPFGSPSGPWGFLGGGIGGMARRGRMLMAPMAAAAAPADAEAAAFGMGDPAAGGELRKRAFDKQLADGRDAGGGDGPAREAAAAAPPPRKNLVETAFFLPTTRYDQV